MGHKLETKYSQKAGSQGGGKAIPVQTGKSTPHGRDLNQKHTDRMYNGGGKPKGKSC
jgi:hypothetical protein